MGTVDYGDTTVPVICALKKQHDIDVTKEPKTETPTIYLKDVLKAYESLIQYLRGMRGVIGVQLSYVMRASNELHPKPSEDDPVTAYVTHNERWSRGHR